MIKKAKKLLPLLVTKQQYVFPNFEKHINVGRPFSLEAVNQAINEHEGHLILISEINPEIKDIKLNNIFNVGVLCRINAEKSTQNTLTINAVGVSRVIINKPVLKDNCYFAEFKVWNYPKTPKTELRKASNLFHQFLKSIGSTVFASFKNRTFDEISLHQFIDALLQNYSSNENNLKQHALEAKTLLEKYKIVVNNMKFNPTIEDEGDIRRLVDQNINKRVKDKLSDQQREFYLREKLNAIREELGEGKDKNDLEQYLKRLEEEPFPIYIKERVRSEIEKLKTLPSTSAEKGMLRGYIDWLIQLPWYQKTTENYDLSKASKELDKNHFGLEKPKRRIIEHLAATIYSKNIAGQIICLVGPPGTGKTSLGFSIAKSLGRNYVRVALGGVKDESEIRGHRRTYLGSYPGKIIQALKKAKSINPVILVDEIDKLSNDYRGDPSSAMLEVLDPEQNREFIDHYIEEPFDLSKVMFIATANYEEHIPEPLHDRMEIIHLSSYTELEKLEIAKTHLIPRILNKFNLKKQQIRFNITGIREIIKYYTREAGVRELERLITQICRKFIVNYLTKKVKTLTIDAKNVHEYIGKRLFEFTLKQNKSEIGVATGLAYTQFGGDILSIESTSFPGDGSLILTGKLGKVMQESAEIAFTYIRANAKRYCIDQKLFNKNNFHIHVPEGAIPKDGPSAGVTITTSLISFLLQKPISRDLAMTGEVTLQGKVLPIGGLKEKAIAAARSNIKTILIPKDNSKNLEDIPAEVKKKLRIVLISNYMEIFNFVFGKLSSTKTLPQEARPLDHQLTVE